MKYIIVNDNGLDQAILFSECLTHSKVAEGFKGQVVGAGFCSIGAPAIADLETWGRSQGLETDHKSDDIAIIDQTITLRT